METRCTAAMRPHPAAAAADEAHSGKQTCSWPQLRKLRHVSLAHTRAADSASAARGARPRRAGPAVRRPHRLGLRAVAHQHACAGRHEHHSGGRWVEHVHCQLWCWCWCGLGSLRVALSTIRRGRGGGGGGAGADRPYYPGIACAVDWRITDPDVSCVVDILIADPPISTSFVLLRLLSPNAVPTPRRRRAGPAPPGQPPPAPPAQCCP